MANRSVVLLVGTSILSLASPAFTQDCPEPVGQLPYGTAYSVAVSGDHAHFGSGAALVIADVSNPASPQVLGHIALHGVILGVAVSGSHAYVTERNEGLRVIDISTPASPVEVGFLDTPGYASAVAVSSGWVIALMVAARIAEQQMGGLRTPLAEAH